MNPFVNPRKRGISLPPKCKDLVDVLRLTRRSSHPARSFLRSVLMQAHEHGAAQLSIGSASGGYSTITEQVGERHYHGSTFPSEFLSPVVAELTRMAALPKGELPKEGFVCLKLEEQQSKWKVQMAGPETEGVITRIRE
jgi:hypothetical protein